jgi:hypothetical protein
MSSAAFMAPTADGGNTVSAASLSPPSGLAVTQSCTAVAATAATDGPLANGTAYPYRLRAYRGAWNSTAVTASIPPSC